MDSGTRRRASRPDIAKTIVAALASVVAVAVFVRSPLRAAGAPAFLHPTTTPIRSAASMHSPTSIPLQVHPGVRNGKAVPTTKKPLALNVYAATVAGLDPKVRGITPRVYVPNSDDGTVSVIDPTTYKVIVNFRVGRNPQHIGPSWDLSTLYVSNDRGNSLTPINPRTGVASTPIPVNDPYNLYFTPDGNSAIVVAERLRRLDFRDPHTWALQYSIAIPHRGANHLDFTADGKTLLISCEFSGWLVKVDMASRKITGELNLKGQPIDVKLSPDGKVFYVANMDRGGVSIIDPTTMTELAFLHTGRGAHGLYPSRDTTKLYVANRMANSVSVIDFATRSVVATWHFTGTPDMGGVSTDGKELWLSGRYSREVYVVDTATGRLTHRIPVGRGPHGLSVFPQPGHFSLGHTGNYR
jgi:YVTN family beta-propeller protein